MRRVLWIAALMCGASLLICSARASDRAEAMSSSIDLLTRMQSLQMGELQRLLVKRGEVALIWNGEPAPQDDYVVGIRYLVDKKQNTCTGILMSRTLVLTAGHCSCGESGSYEVTKSEVLNGASFTSAVGRPVSFDSRACESKQIKPGYDLAVLRLRTELHVDFAYDPLPPLMNDVRLRMTKAGALSVLGFGVTERKTAGTRKRAQIPIYTLDCAALRFADVGCSPFQEMILADRGAPTISSRDSCSGDSGGPVFLDKDSGQVGGRKVLVAITSRPAPFAQVDEERQCGGGGIYTILGRTDVLGWLGGFGIQNVSAILGAPGGRPVTK
jgi:secreted trypsin-like serine protease